jgi:hypothetical protein
VKIRSRVVAFAAAAGLAAGLVIVGGGGVAHAQDIVVIDCDKIAGTGSIKPSLVLAPTDVAVSLKGPVAGNPADFNKPITTPVGCGGVMGGTVGNLTKFSGKLLGNASCDFVSEEPPGDPMEPLAGKVTNTHANNDPATLKPYASQMFLRIKGGDDEFTPEQLDVANGIVIKGVGVGGDVHGSFLFGPTQKNYPELSFINLNEEIVPGLGSLEVGTACIAGIPITFPGRPTAALPALSTLIFGTDGTSLSTLGDPPPPPGEGVLDGDLRIVIPDTTP